MESSEVRAVVSSLPVSWAIVVSAAAVVASVAAGEAQAETRSAIEIAVVNNGFFIVISSLFLCRTTVRIGKIISYFLMLDKRGFRFAAKYFHAERIMYAFTSAARI